MNEYKTAKGMLKDVERELLYTAARQAVPPGGVIVNIGVEYGASVVCLHEGNPDAKLFAIDVIMSKYVGPRMDDIILIETMSETVLKYMWHIGADLVFVDGDHSRNGIIADLKWANYVKSGGHIIFHDCYDWDRGYPHKHGICPEVNQEVESWYRAVTRWRELEHRGTCRVFYRMGEAT